MNKLIQKSIRFPAKAVEIIERDVQINLGIDFNDYIKTYVINKAEQLQRKKYWTPRLRQEIENAKKEVQIGKRKLLETPKDIADYFDALDEE